MPGRRSRGRRYLSGTRPQVGARNARSVSLGSAMPNVCQSSRRSSSPKFRASTLTNTPPSSRTDRSNGRRSMVGAATPLVDAARDTRASTDRSRVTLSGSPRVPAGPAGDVIKTGISVGDSTVSCKRDSASDESEVRCGASSLPMLLYCSQGLRALVGADPGRTLLQRAPHIAAA